MVQVVLVLNQAVLVQGLGFGMGQSSRTTHPSRWRRMQLPHPDIEYDLFNMSTIIRGSFILNLTQICFQTCQKLANLSAQLRRTLQPQSQRLMTLTKRPYARSPDIKIRQLFRSISIFSIKLRVSSTETLKERSAACCGGANINERLIRRD